MKTLITAIVGLAGLLTSVSARADCGPFNMFKDNDYCVTCNNPSKPAFKINNCPGGEYGRVAVGVQNPGCTVEYWSPSCPVRATAATTATTATEAKTTTKTKPKSVHAAPGKAVVSKAGGEVIIRMTQEDFDKLMKMDATK